MGFFVLQGCITYRTIRFRVVDMATGTPLAEVQTSRQSSRVDYLNGPNQEVTYPATGAEGYVVAPRLQSNYEHYFIFSRSGYRTAEAAYAAGNNWVLVTSGEPPYKAAFKPGDIVVVPMRSADGKG